MAMVRFAVTLLVFAQPSAAQQPAAPGAAGDRSIWSDTEAAALHHMRRLVDAAEKSPGRPIRLPAGGLQLPGYRIAGFAPESDGRVRQARSARLEDGVFLLAWPLSYPEKSRRGIVHHGDGTTLFCELEEGEAHDLTAELAIGRGSEGRFADVLKQPGTSSTGHFWLWLQQISRPAVVEVVDEHGEPRSGCGVAFMATSTMRQRPAETGLPKLPWPAGDATTGADGRAKVVGPLCHDLGVTLTPDPHTVVTGQLSFEIVDDALRIVLSSEALRTARLHRNESAAIATLKNLSSAQAQCQASGAIDVDNDGNGEYGYFAELTGTVAVRGGGDRKINPPVLSRAFARIESSCAERNGYLFRIYLPQADSKGAMEADNGGAEGRKIDSNLAEVLWCAYAWPADAESGQRAFFVNQGGDVLACDNVGDGGAPAHVGREHPPSFDAAFAKPGDMAARIAVNRAGTDGQRWRVVP